MTRVEITVKKVGKKPQRIPNETERLSLKTSQLFWQDISFADQENHHCHHQGSHPKEQRKRRNVLGEQRLRPRQLPRRNRHRTESPESDGLAGQAPRTREVERVLRWLRKQLGREAGPWPPPLPLRHDRAPEHGVRPVRTTRGLPWAGRCP